MAGTLPDRQAVVHWGTISDVNIPWEASAWLFEWDGSLLDIYVPDAGVAGWAKMLTALPNGGYAWKYLVDDTPATLPEQPASAFADASERGCLLVVHIDGIDANCHFFENDEIEFDIDPREVKSQQGLDALLGFMQWLVLTVGRDCVLTSENMMDNVLIRVSPTGVVLTRNH